uniref:ferric-chelate reductase 1 n=1 Tax=Myxine glutinosa TaxID=7769 RepID=UPI00358F83A1
MFRERVKPGSVMGEEIRYKVLSILYLVVVAQVQAYSNGKVTKACQTMKPGHGYSSQVTSPPFYISTNSSTFQPGDTLLVHLLGNQTDFKGFLLQAFEEGVGLDKSIGTFSLLDTTAQLLECHQPNDAVSHTDPQYKSKASVLWHSPSVPGTEFIRFRATFVKDYSVFWVAVHGPLIRIPGAASPPTQQTPFVPSTQHSTELSKSFSAAGCGENTTCMRSPSGCLPSSALCFYVGMRTHNGMVNVEMSGPDTGYLGLGFSTDIWMGNDDVYLCVNIHGKLEIQTGWTNGRTHPILDQRVHLSGLAWRLADGVMQCSFQRPVAEKGRANLAEHLFLFLADGYAHNGMVHHHDRQPLVAGPIIPSGPPVEMVGKRGPLYLKAHAALMVTVWLGLVSFGILVARFYRFAWPTQQLCSQKIWFQMHRTAMVMAFALTIVAVCLAFVYRGRWSTVAGAHAYLGITVVILVVIQPIMALFRPHPGTPKRYIFNWVHWAVGMSAWILAVATVFLGVDVRTLDLPDPVDAVPVAGLVVWHLLIEVVLEVYNYTNHHTGWSSRFWNRKKSTPQKGSKFHTVLLVMYILGLLAFLLYFYTLVARF